jgi:hypothetical protein
MLEAVGAALHRIEALPGSGRYAITFRRDDGGEQTAVVDVTPDGVRVAEANLPDGWARDSDTFRATADAVRAVHQARTAGVDVPQLVDVPGGWDVGLGNVVLSAGGVPACTAHGPMAADADAFTCADCGARAALAAPR